VLASLPVDQEWQWLRRVLRARRRLCAAVRSSMATWRVTYRPACDPRAWLVRDVEADELREDARQFTLTGRALVLDQPRDVIALRVDKRELAGKPFRLCEVHARWGGVRL
jgi:hypothetical protein